MTSNPVDENVHEPLVQYVPITDYLLPPVPITQNARKRLASFRRLFQRGDRNEFVPMEPKESLAEVPPCLLNSLAPTPELGEFADALHVHLSDWLRDESTDHTVILIVGAPNSGNKETLENLAERQCWRKLSRPTPDQILKGDGSCLPELGVDDDCPWVLPALEDFYLRHPEGLNLFRDFLDNVLSEKKGRGIIGCDSWAWAYLSHLWRGPMPTILTLRSFDEKKLTSHLQNAVHASCTRQLIFRQSDNGRYILPHKDIDTVSGEYSKFLQILAAHSRGNIGIAMAVWRTCLFAEPGEGLLENNEIEKSDLPYQTIWVIPWSLIDIPILPMDAGRNIAFVLHTLLIHNGLPLGLLILLLPLNSSQTLETLYRLKERGVVVLLMSVWQVSPLGYPAVRDFLQSNSYLVDQF